MRKVTHSDTKSGVEFAFLSAKLNDLLQNKDNSKIDYSVSSKNGKV